MTMRLTVLVPTFLRPRELEQCLRALERQTQMPDEVIVIQRDSDAATRRFLDGFKTKLPLRWVFVHVPGVVAALNRGLEEATGDIIAITDDDAVPREDWLAR